MTGQYATQEECIRKGIFPMIEILREIEHSSSTLYKTYSLYTCKATNKGDTLHDILINSRTRSRDEVRRFKLLLSKIFAEPYWEDAPKHSRTDLYMMGSTPVSGTSLAEACERDKLILSFVHEEFCSGNIEVLKNKVTSIFLVSFSQREEYIEMLRVRGIISFQTYVNFVYQDSKLNFSSIDGHNGFNLIAEEDETLFLDAFRKFNQLSWAEIYQSDGLDYKEYTNTQKETISIFHSKKIHKFRISQKYRCFGEVINGVFHVLMFDLTHKLSD